MAEKIYLKNLAVKEAIGGFQQEQDKENRNIHTMWKITMQVGKRKALGHQHGNRAMVGYNREAVGLMGSINKRGRLDQWQHRTKTTWGRKNNDNKLSNAKKYD
jgi:hypothetical protein